MFRKSFVLAAAIGLMAATGATSSPAYQASGSFSVKIRGFVPVICRATVDANYVSPEAGLVPIGEMNEFCNSPRGYEVWADYSDSLSEAALVVDGKTVPLSETGTTRISTSSTAGVAKRDLALDLPSDAVTGSLSIRMVAL